MRTRTGAGGSSGAARTHHPVGAAPTLLFTAQVGGDTWELAKGKTDLSQPWESVRKAEGPFVQGLEGDPGGSWAGRRKTSGAEAPHAVEWGLGEGGTGGSPSPSWPAASLVYLVRGFLGIQPDQGTDSNSPLPGAPHKGVAIGITSDPRDHFPNLKSGRGAVGTRYRVSRA